MFSSADILDTAETNTAGMTVGTLGTTDNMLEIADILGQCKHTRHRT